MPQTESESQETEAPSFEETPLDAIIMPRTEIESQETEANSLEEKPASLDETTTPPMEIETQEAEEAEAEVSQQPPPPETEVSQPPMMFVEDPLQLKESASSLVNSPVAPASPIFSPVASPASAGIPDPVFAETPAPAP
jgi:hypothetical protein